MDNMISLCSQDAGSVFENHAFAPPIRLRPPPGNYQQDSVSCGVYAIAACKTIVYQLNNGHKLSTVALNTVNVDFERATILLDTATQAQESEQSPSRSNKRHQERRLAKRRKANTNNLSREIIDLATDEKLPSKTVQQDDAERHQLAFGPLPQDTTAECDGEGHEQGFGVPLPDMEEEKEGAAGNVLGFGVPPQNMMEEDDVERNGSRFGSPPPNMMEEDDNAGAGGLEFGPPPPNMMEGDDDAGAGGLGFQSFPANMMKGGDDDLSFGPPPANMTYHSSTGQYSILPTLEEFWDSKGYDPRGRSNQMFGKCTCGDHRC